ncbi:MAG: YitT family protein [Bacilli bacterium]|nr:YitT family protein [Bacilli bacterium]
MPIDRKKKAWPVIKSLLFMAVGSFLLAVADALFLSPYNINPGGIFGIAVAVNSLFPGFDCQDIVTTILQVALFLVGCFVLGMKFSLRTLIASVLYPLFFALLYRIRVNGSTLSQLIIGTVDSSDPAYMTKMVLAGISGGALVGTGVGISFLGKGSTGGSDILCEIIAKYTDIKQDVSSFVFDVLVVIIGACIMWPMGNTDIWKIIVGIASALVCAAMIQLVFVSWNTNLVADIISSEDEKILEFIHNNMDRGSTIYQVTGGYSGEDKKIIRVAFSKRQLTAFKEFIAEVDPNAFVTIIPCSSINGEGFSAHQKRRRDSKKRGDEQ